MFSRAMTRRSAWLAPVLMVLLASTPTWASDDATKLDAKKPADETACVECSPAEAPAKPGSKGHGKLVFVLTTGTEDLQTAASVFNHSVLAHQSGFLDDTVLLVYGRSVQLFDRNITAKPPSIPQAIQKAQDAGVRIIVCAEALRKFDIPEDRLEPGVAEVVPNTIPTLAELVSKGYQVIKY